jgi:hypothetical protein
MTLRESLQDWTDIDVAAWRLAQVIGVIGSDKELRDIKWMFFSANPVGDALYRSLDELRMAGVLEKRDEPDFQYRWRLDA